MRVMLISAILVCTATAAAAAAGGPTPDDSAETWFARADREIAAIPDPHGPKFIGLSAKSLALIACDADPSDARRAAAVLRIREQLKADLEASGSPVSDRLHTANAAADLAEVGDLIGARSMLQGDASSRRSSTGRARSNSPLEEAAILARAYTLVRLGDLDAVPDLPDGSYAAAIAASYECRFRDASHDDMADTFRSLVCRTGTGEGRWRELADRGYYPDAIAVTDLLRPKSAGPACQMEIAVMADRAGYPEWKRRVARRILARLQGDPDPELLTRALPLLEFCAVARDRDGVDEVGAFVDQHDAAFQPIVRETSLASAYAAVGETEKYRQHIGVAAELTAKESAGPEGPRIQSFFFCVDVAAAYARAGDRNHAMAMIVDAKAIADACGCRIDFDPVELAFVRAGLFDDALRVAKLDASWGSWRTPSRVARAMARSGRFDDALAVGSTIEESYRPPVWAYIAREQVRQHRTNGLAGWVAALPTPETRAAVSLGIALEISGRPNQLYEAWIDRGSIDD
jgi:hypothetical protein